MGISNGIINTLLGATIQGMIADEYRGRMMSLNMLIATGLMPIALALAGGLSDAVGSSMVFVAGGVLCVVTSLVGLTFREIRGLK
jgi:MFS family permease